MKKLNFTISSWISRLCAVCLALLGFSCSSEDDPDDILCMYGTPTGDFEVKGSVKTADGTPVENAIVRVTDQRAPSGLWSIEADTTGVDGRYSLSGRDLLVDAKVVCIPLQNTLEADSINVTLNYKRDGSEGTWDLGSTSVTVDFVLKKRDPDTESK